ncbi:hypothetical protein ACFXD5_12015 [Streptomyces sp. NPDC059385]|uniref:hypothetical protein n=1 Tax=Streptomyces sp. NPDC059385 TaxID=3346817 RepID=UPI00369B1041
MAASAQSGQSVAVQTADVAACQRDYQAAQAQRAESAGAQRDQLGSAIGAQQHTHR